MSTRRRKRIKINHITLEDAAKKTMKAGVLLNDKKHVNMPKPPIVAPNGKIFYPCQYCCKIFTKKITSVSHMAKCPKNNEKAEVQSESKLGINNNESEDTIHLEEEVNSSSSTENTPPVAETNINRTVTDKDTSIYDYDEQDDSSDEKDRHGEGSEESANNRLCKHCGTQFDNPLDLLRHTRDCHNFPRKILPPDEIEKYFDYPNREFCPICEKPIKTRNFRSVFIKHLLVHTTGLMHECGICKKKFRRRDHMRAHEKRHIVSV